jgi:hypothetical protein
MLPDARIASPGLHLDYDCRIHILKMNLPSITYLRPTFALQPYVRTGLKPDVAVSTVIQVREV